MAFVYWIKARSDTDIYSQGYVGITSKTVQQRLNQHKKFSKRQNRKLNSLLTSGEFDVITLCECSVEYAGFLENKLRPSEFIGLNRAIGGNIVKMTSEGKKAVSEALTGRTKSEQHRLNLSKAKTGKKLSDEYRKKMSEDRKGRPFYKNREDLDAHLEKMRNKCPLDLPRVNLDVWVKIEMLYELYLEGETTYSAAKKIGFGKGSLKGMWCKFQRGYDYHKDQRMIEFLKLNRLGK